MNPAYRVLRQSVGLLERALLPLISRSYSLHKLHARAHLARSFRRQPLLVHQMGKVGSSTVAASLNAAPGVTARHSVYHVHFLTPGRLAREERLYRDAAVRARGRLPGRRFHPHYVWTGQFLAERLATDSRRWTIVTLVREPLSRRVSSFFENLESLLGYDYPSRLRTQGMDRVLAELHQLFLERYLDEPPGQEIDADPHTWFQEELEGVFGVDVYGSSFSPEQGYQIYEAPRARVLLLRLEDLDRTLGPGLRELLGVDVPLVRANVAENKGYAELYSHFVDSLELSTAQVERTYASRYCRHFYAPGEIERFRRKWSRPRAR
jgi:hypothetical protein